MLLRLHIGASRSLKDKRQVTRSLVARLGHQFGVSVAEVGELGAWQVAQLGIAHVSNEVQQTERVLDAALRYIEEMRPDVEISVDGREVLSVF